MEGMPGFNLMTFLGLDTLQLTQEKEKAKSIIVLVFVLRVHFLESQQ